MAKNKKSKILAMALCASVMTGIYAAPVMAADTDIEAIDGNINFKIDGNTVGTISHDNTWGFYRLNFQGSALYVGSISTGGTSMYTDGRIFGAHGKFAVEANGLNIYSDNERTDKTFGINYDDGSFEAAGGKFTVDNAGRVTTSRLFLNDVTVDADRDGNSLTVGSSTLSFDEANETITNTEAIRRVVDKEHKMSATYLEETVKAHSAFGLQVLDENGEAVATISRGGSGTFNGTVTARDVNSNAHSVLSSAGLQLYNADGTSKVNITNTGASRFGAFDETSVRIENGQLQIRAANTAENADSSGPLLASLSEKGLTLVDDDRKYSTLTAAQLANLNSTIKEGGVVDANELNVSGETGGLYIKDVTNEDDETGTMIFAGPSQDGDSTLRIDPKNGNLSTKGSIAVVGEKGSWEAPTTIIDGKTGNVAVGSKIHLDAANGAVTAYTYNGVKLATDGNKVLVGDIDVSELSTAATDISDLQNRTQYITGASYDTTYFKGAIKSTGDISSGNGAVTLSGNYGKEAAVTLRDAEGNPYALTATQLGNINNMITGAGVLENVVSINGAAVEGVGNGGLKISGVELENGLINGVNINDLDKAVAGTSANIGGIEREAEDGAAPGEGTTTIENNLKVSGDKINMFGDTGLTFDKGTMNGVNVINVSGNIGFNGSNVHFSYGSDGKTTTLGGLALTVDQIATDVSAIKEKTDHITVDDKGNVTISADDGSSLTVGNNGTSTGQGGQVTTDGNHTVNGDLDVDGSGQIDKDLTVGGDLEVGGSITTGNTTIDGSGMTVGDGTTITDGKVSSTEGAFGNITSNTGTIGNATFDENGMTVGTADKGTTVSDSGVSIKNEYGSVETGVVDGKNDVVVTDEDGNRTSLVDTAGRVDNLEQGVAELNNRVGELEDRIDKVGAMAAAIANLRTMGYDPAAPTEVAVGIGQYRDETGAALGLFHYPNRDFMLSLSVSTSGDEVMGGIGATWKFGRKSPEKVAEIKKAQAEADARRAEEAKLAKAEEMKQAAKEAKIKAQQERHAKLAAERAAQAEAAK